MNYLILSTQADFNTLNGQLNAAFGYPTSDGRTLTYAQPITGPNGQFAMLIQDRCLPYLTTTQQQALQTDSQMKANGWFPVPTGPLGV